MVQSLLDVALAGFVLAICYGIGRLLLNNLDHGLLSFTELLCFSIAIGTGVVATPILIIGLFSLLHVWILCVLLLALGFIGRYQLMSLPGVLKECARELQDNCGSVSLIFFALVASFIIVHSFLPPTDWDALMYHLSVPQHFLENAQIRVPADNLHIAYMGPAHMLYLPLLALGSSSAPAVLSALFAILLGLAVCAASARLLGKQVANLSTPLLWGTTSLILIAITPRVDVTLALLLFLAHYAVILEMEGGANRFGALSLVSAAIFGFATGIKYHALVYAAALVPLLLWPAFQASSPKVSATWILKLGLVLGMCALPWLFKNWWLLDAPLYPFFTDNVLPPWLAAIAGTEDIPSSVGPEPHLALGRARKPFNLRDLFLAPGRLTVEGEGGAYFTNPIFLLLPLGLFLIRNRRLVWLLIPPVMYVILVVLPVPAINLRYLVPAVPALTIAAAGILVGIGLRFGQQARRVVVAGITIAALVPTFVVMTAWTYRLNGVEYILGLASREEYLSKHVRKHASYQAMVRYTNEHVSREGLVLLLFEARGYYFEVPIIQDNLLTNWPLLASVGLADTCLSRTHITHIIVNTGMISYYERRGMDTGPLQWEKFPRFAEACLTPEFEIGGVVLYRLDRDSEQDHSGEPGSSR